jgi:hypothetical protein
VPRLGQAEQEHALHERHGVIIPGGGLDAKALLAYSPGRHSSWNAFSGGPQPVVGERWSGHKM